MSDQLWLCKAILGGEPAVQARTPFQIVREKKHQSFSHCLRTHEKSAFCFDPVIPVCRIRNSSRQEVEEPLKNDNIRALLFLELTFTEK